MSESGWASECEWVSERANVHRSASLTGLAQHQRVARGYLFVLTEHFCQTWLGFGHCWFSSLPLFSSMRTWVQGGWGLVKPVIFKHVQQRRFACVVQSQKHKLSRLVHEAFECGRGVGALCCTWWGQGWKDRERRKDMDTLTPYFPHSPYQGTLEYRETNPR